MHGWRDPALVMGLGSPADTEAALRRQERNQMDDIDLYIDETGDIQGIYSDTLAAVFADEPTAVKRASHVEPHPSRTGWIADMRPSGGPVLGKGGEWQPQSRLPLEFIGDLERQFVGMLDPFTTRDAALAAERAWLDAKLRTGHLEIGL